MTAAAYLMLVAATNFKQRTRKMFDYYHADRLNYAVCGTPNRLEYDQGFFVKGGDGLADFKPIAHLYKTQVYAVARALKEPEEILRRTPTTDTFPLPQTQEEFYFSLPYEKMDLCLYAHNRGLAPAEVAPVVGITPEQVERVYRDIDAKRRTTLPLHLPALLVDPVTEVQQLKSAATGSPS
jgi:NAD+ synthase